MVSLFSFGESVRWIPALLLIVAGCHSVTDPGLERVRPLGFPSDTVSAAPAPQTPDSLFAGMRLTASSMTGALGREVTVVARCVAAAGEVVEEVSWSGLPGPERRAVPDAARTWEEHRSVTIDQHFLTFAQCTDSGGTVYRSPVRELVAEAPRIQSPAYTMPRLSIHEPSGIPFSALMANVTEMTVAERSGNLVRAVARGDSLFLEADGTDATYWISVRGASPFGSLTHTFSGEAQRTPKVFLVTNVTSIVTFMDAAGNPLLEQEIRSPDPSVRMADIPDAATQLVLRAVDGSRFDRRADFEKPAQGGSLILRLATVSRAPCLEYERAWGRSMEACVELLTATLFKAAPGQGAGYIRGEPGRTGIVATLHPLTHAALTLPWHTAILDALALFTDNGVDLDLRADPHRLSPSDFVEFDGAVWPRNPGVLLLPDHGDEVAVDYRWRTPYDPSASVIRLPIATPPAMHAEALSRALFRAFLPFLSEGRFEALPPTEQRWFMREVILPMRRADEHYVHLEAGVSAQDVLRRGTL